MTRDKETNLNSMTDYSKGKLDFLKGSIKTLFLDDHYLRESKPYGPLHN